MPLQKTKVLVLNASYEPLSICDARNAFLLLFGGKAVTVSNHPHNLVRTVSRSIPLPSIVRLKNYARIHSRRPPLNRKNIFRRDGFRCQYCGRSDQPLTIDHMVPKSKGGDESWENLITACRTCNAIKGDRTPSEAGMKTMSEPSRPTRIVLLRQENLHVIEEWKPFLYMV